MLRIVIAISFVCLTLCSNAQIVSLDSIGGYLGKNVTIFGKVDDGRYLSGASNQPTLLNMGGKFPNQKLTLVIYGNSRANFGYKPEEALVNKNIYATGKVELYRGKPQIIIQNPFDIAFSAPANANSAALSQTPKIEEQKPVETGRNVNRERKEPEVKREEKRQENKITAKTLPANNTSRQTPPTRVTVIQNTNVAKGAEITTNSSLTVKGGPGTHFTTVGNLKKGTVVSVVSTSYGWSKIVEKTADGTAAVSGYVKSEKLN